jgi:hypothetical protein
MPIFIVKLARPATELATIEVEADREVNAMNIAFKFVDRHHGDKVNPRVKMSHFELRSGNRGTWEEESVDKV